MTLCGRVRLEVTGGRNWMQPGSQALAWFLSAPFTHTYNVNCEQKAEQNGKSSLVRKAFINLKLKAWILKLPLFRKGNFAPHNMKNNLRTCQESGSGIHARLKCFCYWSLCSQCYGSCLLRVRLLLLMRRCGGAAVSEMVVVHAGSLGVCLLAMTAG